MKKEREILEQKFQNKKQFNEKEIRSIVQNESDFRIVDEMEGVDGILYQEIRTILEVKNKLFAIEWKIESNGKFIYKQPYEIIKKIRTSTGTYYESVETKTENK